MIAPSPWPKKQEAKAEKHAGPLRQTFWDCGAHSSPAVLLAIDIESLEGSRDDITEVGREELPSTSMTKANC
jgi:hypothetical protein